MKIDHKDILNFLEAYKTSDESGTIYFVPTECLKDFILKKIEEGGTDVRS